VSLDSKTPCDFVSDLFLLPTMSVRSGAVILRTAHDVPSYSPVLHKCVLPSSSFRMNCGSRLCMRGLMGSNNKATYGNHSVVRGSVER
jgi:hypothetical protein